MVEDNKRPMKGYDSPCGAGPSIHCPRYLTKKPYGACPARQPAGHAGSQDCRPRRRKQDSCRVVLLRAATHHASQYRRFSFYNSNSRGAGALALAYALGRQLVEQLPGRFDSSSSTSLDLSAARLEMLDGTTQTWDDVLTLMPHTVFCVIHGLHWLDDHSAEGDVARRRRGWTTRGSRGFPWELSGF